MDFRKFNMANLHWLTAFLCQTLHVNNYVDATDGVGLLTASLQYFLAREKDAPLVVVCTHFQGRAIPGIASSSQAYHCALSAGVPDRILVLARRVRDTFANGRLPDGSLDSNRDSLAPLLKALEEFLRNGDCSDLEQVSAFATKWLKSS
ncbi:hypothetical protein IWQ61_003698 [Dispira simplex]|nr:hypothetical protein IWQ61_003698 [Dispira simplex]